LRLFVLNQGYAALMPAGSLLHHARHAADYRPNHMYPNAVMPSTAPSMETDSATTASPSDAPHAVFLYPTGEPTVNNIDTVQVSYETIWEHANLTLFCESDNEDTWAMAAINMRMQNYGHDKFTVN